MKVHILAAATAVIAASLLTVSPSAVAEDPNADHRPCVSNREANSLKANTYRSVVEAKWEVGGKGIPVMSTVGPMVAYPWCGHGGLSRAYVAIQYRNGGKSGFMEQWDCRWDQPVTC